MSVSKISLSLGGVRRAPPPTNGVKRPRAALHEEDEDDSFPGKSEAVSHFDKKAGGAIDATKRKEDPAPLIIPRMANRDWKEAATKRKRQKSGLPENAGRAGNMDQKMAEVEAADAAKKPGFGLNLYKKQDNGDEAMENGEADTVVPEAEDDDNVQAKARTDEELAMDALLGKTITNRHLVIGAPDPITEADAFQHDFEEAPDMATLDDYARVPVEDFGAAMLRGMGWKEGEGIGSQKGKTLPKEINNLPERRANLLGIGAKEDAALAQEMGVWGKAAKGSKEVKIYNPVLLRDKKTGNMYTEEELQKKREQDERTKYEEAFEREERDRETYRRKDDESLYDSRDRRRRGDDRNDRDRDSRRHDKESDDESYARKERERRRRREKDERDKGHGRSRQRKDRDDEYRDKHRHRDHRDHRDRDRGRR